MDILYSANTPNYDKFDSRTLKIVIGHKKGKYLRYSSLHLFSEQYHIQIVKLFIKTLKYIQNNQ
jgi:hypothetical protein